MIIIDKRLPGQIFKAKQEFELALSKVLPKEEKVEQKPSKK